MGAGDWPSVRWIINNTADRAQFIWPFSPCNWLSFKLGVRAESSHGLDTIWSVRARHQSVSTCNYQVPPQSSLTLRGLTTYDRFKTSSESRPLSFSWRCSNRYSRRSSLCCTWVTSPSLSLKSPSVGAGGGAGRCSSTGSNMCCDCSVAESPSPGTHWLSDSQRQWPAHLSLPHHHHHHQPHSRPHILR